VPRFTPDTAGQDFRSLRPTRETVVYAYGIGDTHVQPFSANPTTRSQIGGRR
jgi:hypothetical protein